jgi:toxin ParE1/3/4
MAFRLTLEAESDIEAVALYIAIDSPSVAERWYDDMLERCRRLGEMPGMGVSRPYIRPDLRTLPAGNYLILYREIKTGVEIVRAVHGARQWQDLL